MTDNFSNISILDIEERLNVLGWDGKYGMLQNSG